MRQEFFGNEIVAPQPEIVLVNKWKQMEFFVEKVFAQPNLNAIDMLLQISQYLKNHRELHYANFQGGEEDLKRFYTEDLSRRITFSSEKIAHNFALGQQQKLYRNDISSEIVARSYAKRVLDLHNPKIFPPQELSHRLIYLFMFESVIRGLSTRDGLKYFENLKG
ncbi:MAG: hypothetical protein IEMM0006_0243 [bacterium]|nr:MAG: hypothetical protein IEMM0006_0243 [bacterium]